MTFRPMAFAEIAVNAKVGNKPIKKVVILERGGLRKRG